MIPIEVYKKFLLKLNKNDTITNIKVPKAQFVLMFNEQKRKWLDIAINRLESSSDIEDIEEVLQTDVKLTKVEDLDVKSDFLLPANFYKRVSSYSVASKGECKRSVIVNWFVKPKDLQVLLQNEHYKPSFEYQETLAIINNGKVSVYKDAFKVNEAYLTYYKNPKDINLAGFKQFDGTPSFDQEVDLSDSNTEHIIDLTVIEAAKNYESMEQLQAAVQALQLKK